MISTFFSEHLIVAALLISALWSFVGYREVKKGKRLVGLSWQLVGVFILIAFCFNAALSSAWYSLAVALGAMMVELWLIRGQRYRQTE